MPLPISTHNRLIQQVNDLEDKVSSTSVQLTNIHTSVGRTLSHINKLDDTDERLPNFALVAVLTLLDMAVQVTHANNDEVRSLLNRLHNDLLNSRE